MAPARPRHIEPTPELAPPPSSGVLLLAGRSGLYIVLLLGAILAAGFYSFRAYGIFDCQASGYSSDGYLAYCGATSYGDYDHGAFWYGLEPAARQAAESARVLFVGNSRMQFGFSTAATADWFASLPASYYLLGFSHFENYTFEEPLIEKLRPKARVYVINLDAFFDTTESGPGKTVMEDESAGQRYAQKRQWQGIHKTVCSAFRALCGNGTAYFRSRSVGSWRATGHGFSSEPVSYDDDVDRNRAGASAALGNRFLSTLPVSRECTILTMVPTVKTEVGTAKSIAAALGTNLVAPELTGLSTFDRSHLDPASAKRWSAAFFEAAGPRIRSCLND